jgi:hypothetical protein
MARNIKRKRIYFLDMKLSCRTSYFKYHRYTIRLQKIYFDGGISVRKELHTATCFGIPSGYSVKKEWLYCQAYLSSADTKSAWMREPYRAEMQVNLQHKLGALLMKVHILKTQVQQQNCLICNYSVILVSCYFQWHTWIKYHAGRNLSFSIFCHKMTKSVMLTLFDNRNKFYWTRQEQSFSFTLMWTSS